MNPGDLFDLPEDIVFLNTAYMGPALRPAREAGIEAVAKLSNPLNFKAPEFFDPPTRVRKLFAQVIDCDDPDRIALTPSCSYGMANAARQIHPSRHNNIVVAEGQFPSNFFIWKRLAEESGCELRRVPPPNQSEGRGRLWNQSILNAIDANTSLVAIAPLHWADGTVFNLRAIREKTLGSRALLIVDGSQAVGAMPISVRELKPDALICAGYKWLFGPYGTGYAYYSDYFDGGTPMEENWIIRENSDDFQNLLNYNPNHWPKGMRYSSGEHSAPIHIAMQEAALKQLLEWGPERIQAYTGELFEPFEDRFRELGCQLEEKAFRANHMFGIRMPEGVDLQKLKARLEEARVVVSFRGSALRISLHFFNKKNDLERLFECVRTQVTG
ncbi:MAG: aminotransferase class V-fold PLP-dependent enzyme [Saprospirales bacterium]|nr:aminotransferase class V-fold PLP-dependent enzyme [Saprospirales bacterium]